MDRILTKDEIKQIESDTKFKFTGKRSGIYSFVFKESSAGKTTGMKTLKITTEGSDIIVKMSYENFSEFRNISIPMKIMLSLNNIFLGAIKNFNEVQNEK